MNYEKYKELRSLYGQHPLTPASVLTIRHAFRQAVDKQPAYDAEIAAFAIDLENTNARSDRAPYLASDVTLPAVLGFDAAHLSARVEVSSDEWLETIEETTKNQGFELEKCTSDYYSKAPDEYVGRPHPQAVRVDISDYRSRGNHYWLSMPEKDLQYWYCGNAYDGLSHSQKADVRRNIAKRVNKSQADWCRKAANDGISMLSIELKVYWRGEEVASASAGGYETASQYGRALDLEVAACVLDLWCAASDELEKWADSAVIDAQREAAKIVGEIALLPERSIAAVRDQFVTATVHKIA